MSKVAKQLNINCLERKIFWSLTVLLVFSSIMYAYLVNQTILNIVERENIEGDLVTLNSTISELEFDYISLKNDIDLDYAHSVGFVNVKNVKFASRKLPGQTLTLRDE